MRLPEFWWPQWSWIWRSGGTSFAVGGGTLRAGRGPARPGSLGGGAVPPTGSLHTSNSQQACANWGSNSKDVNRATDVALTWYGEKSGWFGTLGSGSVFKIRFRIWIWHPNRKRLTRCHLLKSINNLVTNKLLEGLRLLPEPGNTSWRLRHRNLCLLNLICSIIVCFLGWMGWNLQLFEFFKHWVWNYDDLVYFLVHF